MRRSALFAVCLFALAGCSGKIDMEKEAMNFLYEYSPAADIMDNDEAFFRANVRASLQTRKEMPWGASVPDDLFLHFVIPIRVNNEPLDTARLVFYRELKPLVDSLSAEDAILEVNHWCHEKVTYRPSDARTSSPLQSVRSSFGRCGEESTLLVAALRSVGIPARQVYTPRWAHTDDNHAWVEAWANGKWHFLGACEPEPVLDLGWFNAPASRGLLMHTKVFGHYEGPEEVVFEGPNYTEINLTANYTAVAPIKVHVEDSLGRAVDSARVAFCIYNYAEFYPAVSEYTDASGEVRMSAGKGDMLVWASKDGLCGHALASFGRDSLVRIVLGKVPVSAYEALDIVPPAENVVMPVVSAAQRALNDKRLSSEDSIRNAYMASFENDTTAAIFAVSAGAIGADTLTVKNLLLRSYGNYQIIKDFLRSHGCDSRSIALLTSLSQKDLRDVSAEILEDNYQAVGSVLCPRVENEYLSAYKGFFADVLSPDEVSSLSSPFNLITWVRKNIEVDDTPGAWDIPMSPKAVWNRRKAPARSRDIFFVALARTLGIDARKDPVTGKIQYRKASATALGPAPGVKGLRAEADSSEGTWTDVDFDGGVKTVAPEGRLVLTFKPSAGVSEPKYYLNFTISRISGGRPSLLEYDEGEVDMGGGAGWQTFAEGVNLDEGEYELVCGSRLPDGSIPASLTFFRIVKDSTTTVELVIRESDESPARIGAFSAPKGVSLKAGKYVLGLLGAGGEPCDHALRDIAKVAPLFERERIPVLLVCPSEEQKAGLEKDISAGRFGKLPVSTSLITDDGGLAPQIEKLLGRSLKSSDFPVFVVADSRKNAWFLSHGYTINLGEGLLRECTK